MSHKNGDLVRRWGALPPNPRAAAGACRLGAAEGLHLLLRGPAAPLSDFPREALFAIFRLKAGPGGRYSGSLYKYCKMAC